MSENKIKVYVVGGSTGYVNWFGRELVNTIEEADLVFFTGGSDVDPALYMSPKSKLTHCSTDRDVFEGAVAKKAMELGKPIFGTCRGIQLGCVMSGGKLVQHMNHPSMHNLTMYDGTVFATNSLHHQLQHPHHGINRDDFVIIAWAKGLSNVYLNGDDNDMILPTVSGIHSYSKEPELVYYRKTNWLGIQGHPEMMAFDSPMNVILRRLLKLQLAGTLDKVLTLALPMTRWTKVDSLEFTEEEDKLYNEIISKRKVLTAVEEVN